MSRRLDGEHIHFVDQMPNFVCGKNSMVPGPTKDGAGEPRLLFYLHMSNCFALVSCPACRIWIYDNKLSPGQFQKPDEWIKDP